MHGLLLALLEWSKISRYGKHNRAESTNTRCEDQLETGGEHFVLNAWIALLLGLMGAVLSRCLAVTSLFGGARTVKGKRFGAAGWPTVTSVTVFLLFKLCYSPALCDDMDLALPF
jgi:hypothetical protein